MRDNLVEQKCPKTKAEMDEYFRANVKLLHKLLQNYVMPHGAMDYEDLFQHASIGFFKGMATYSPSRGTKLSTYCYQCADNEVKQVFRQMNSKGRKADIAPLSIDSVHQDDEDRGGLLQETIDVPEGGINPRKVNPEEEAEVTAMKEIIAKTCRTKLTEVEAKVFGMAANGYTQTEIASELHISQANVSKNLAVGRSKVALELARAGFLKNTRDYTPKVKPAEEHDEDDGELEFIFEEIVDDNLASGK